MENQEKKPRNPNAFPSDYETTHNGMTMRDYFAAKAMEAALTNENTRRFADSRFPQLSDMLNAIAKGSYQVADAMLKEREKGISQCYTIENSRTY